MRIIKAQISLRIRVVSEPLLSLLRWYDTCTYCLYTLQTGQDAERKICFVHFVVILVVTVMLL